MRTMRHMFAALILVLGLVVVSLAGSPAGVRAESAEGMKLLHVPMRWCVLAGTEAAQDPDGAVLKRLRRGSAVLAPKALVTLRSAVNRRFLESRGFPIIEVDKLKSGKRGRVRVPTESMDEYRRVRDECKRAWKRMRLQDDETKDIDALAIGPVGVIIGEFVDGRGRVVSDVWGYATTAKTNSSYCSGPTIDFAKFGSLMIVDSADGWPTKRLDRRLVAHEFGHILKLGHGDGIDNRPPNRLIDKWCDDGEDPDIRPGSVMTKSLSYEGVTRWQRSLSRRVARKHPAILADPPMVLEPAGVLGDDAPDEIEDATPAGAMSAANVDLEAFEFSLDLETMDAAFTHSLVGTVRTEGPTEFAVFADFDLDESTGGFPNDDFGQPRGYDTDLRGIDFITSLWVEGDRIIDAAAWTWEPEAGPFGMFVESDAITRVDLLTSRDEESVTPGSDGVIVLFDGTRAGLFDGSPADLTKQIRAHAVARTWDDDGAEVVDGLPGDAWGVELVPLSLDLPEFPLCAVNGDNGRADPGGVALLEVTGFDAEGAPVTIWLGDRDEPIALGDYSAVGDEVWATEIEIPSDAEEVLQVVSVVLDGTALTAECPVLIGAAEPPEVE